MGKKERNLALKVRTASGLTVERVSTQDRGVYYLVKSPCGIKVPLDAWNPQSSKEIRTLAQLASVLARYGQEIPAEFTQA